MGRVIWFVVLLFFVFYWETMVFYCLNFKLYGLIIGWMIEDLYKFLFNFYSFT